MERIVDHATVAKDAGHASTGAEVSKIEIRYAQVNHTVGNSSHRRIKISRYLKGEFTVRADMVGEILAGPPIKGRQGTRHIVDHDTGIDERLGSFHLSFEPFVGSYGHSSGFLHGGGSVYDWFVKGVLRVDLNAPGQVERHGDHLLQVSLLWLWSQLNRHGALRLILVATASA